MNKEASNVKQSRRQYLKKNIVVGFVAQFATVLLTFISRRLFVRFLSIEYLGISGLYSNILSVLSLAELGMGSAMTFSLYKPVAENNQPMIRSMVRHFKKLYLLIASVVLVIGLSVTPFLRYIVKSDLSHNELAIYYLLFLVNTVSTYFVANKTMLLTAYQDSRTAKVVNIVSSVFQQIIQIAILLIYPNYLLYTVAGIFVSIFSKFVLDYVTDKRFAFLKEKTNEEATFDQAVIRKNIMATALYKLSAVLINGTDNILISIIVSTVAVGLYSNYCTVTTTLTLFINIITGALICGVGNLYVDKNKKKLLEVFNVLTWVYHLIACFCGITLCFVFNDFIAIWLGKEYVLGNWPVFTIALNFYVTNITTPVWSFREATGQFYRTKYTMFACALLNIGLSVLFGILWGVGGILFATVVSKLLTIIWYEPQVLFKNVFEAEVKVYLKNQSRNLFCTICCFFACKMISDALGGNLLTIILKAFLFMLVCFAFFIVFDRKNKSFFVICKMITKKAK